MKSIIIGLLLIAQPALAQTGLASWYGPGFNGRKAADRSRYDQEKLTAAHKTLPFGTKLLITNKKTKTQVIVKITDRGPYVKRRVLDLSKAAARRLKMLSSGVVLVDYVVVR